MLVTTFRSRLQQILGVMVPILITQLSLAAMSLFDTVMSGHAGTVQLAGVAIGSNIWMPVFTGLMVFCRRLPRLWPIIGVPGKTKIFLVRWSADFFGSLSGTSDYCHG